VNHGVIFAIAPSKECAVVDESGIGKKRIRMRTPKVGGDRSVDKTTTGAICSRNAPASMAGAITFSSKSGKLENNKIDCDFGRARSPRIVASNIIKSLEPLGLQAKLFEASLGKNRKNTEIISARLPEEPPEKLNYSHSAE